MLAQKFGEEEVDRTLNQEHRAVFEAWLRLSLADQTAEMETYAAAQEAPRRAVFSAWARERRYERLIPAAAAKPQRELFVTDMEMILEVLLAR